MQLQRAPAGGLDKFGQHYGGGEFVPFFVPRILMPQVEGQYYDEFRQFAGDLVSEARSVDPHTLVPHQKIEVSYAINLTPEIAGKPILVSRDSYILDGHHRWYWHITQPQEMNTLVVDKDFEDAIAFLFEFPKTYCYRDNPGDER